MGNIIAEGQNLIELNKYDLSGKEIKLYYDHELSPEEVGYIQAELQGYLSGPVRAEGNVLIITLAQSEPIEGYALVPIIWLAILGLGGFLGYQVLQPSGTLENLLEKPLVVLSVGVAIALVLYSAVKAKYPAAR